MATPAVAGSSPPAKRAVVSDSDSSSSSSGAIASPLCCYALRLKPGEEIKTTLLRFVKENALTAPFVLSCVGSVCSAQLRLANDESHKSEIINLSDYYEIVSLVGTLADSGHLHASLSDHRGNVIGGHVMGNMIVFTTAEVVIGSCSALHFQREMDSQTGFPELTIRQA